jgi:hypothetical protein
LFLTGSHEFAIADFEQNLSKEETDGTTLHPIFGSFVVSVISAVNDPYLMFDIDV